MGRVPQSRMSMSGWAAIACASQKGDSIAQRLAAASAVSRRDVQIATTSTPGTERHAGRWAKAPQFALMIPTFNVIAVFLRRLAEFRAQRFFVGLADGGLRNGVDELERLRCMKRSFALRHPGNQLFRCCILSGTQHNQRFDGLAPLGMRHADDSALRDCRMLTQYVLD